MAGPFLRTAAASILLSIVLVEGVVELPNVNECNLCKYCHIDRPWDEHQGWDADSGWHTKGFPSHPRPGMFRPQDTLEKKKLPNCEECYGCKTRLTFINSTASFFNFTFANVAGASPGWIFKAEAPRQAPAVVKVYCVPLAKVSWRGVPLCANWKIMKRVSMFRAVQQISDDCGLGDIIPKVWVDKVDAVMPGVGYHIRWHGIWMEHAPGISLGNLIKIGSQSHPQQVLDLLQHKLNGSQIIRAAVFDLLTSQCDRHLQNLLISEEGQVKIIDNEAGLYSGFDSFLLPTSRHQARGILGDAYVFRRSKVLSPPDGIAPLQLLLDYRCHLPQGRALLGRNFHPQLKKCLSNMAKMNLDQIQARYGLEEHPAVTLQSRAQDLINMGFEWTIKNGFPGNIESQRYATQPKCCSIKLGADGQYRCEHPWKRITQLPPEDAWSRANSGKQTRRRRRRARPAARGPYDPIVVRTGLPITK